MLKIREVKCDFGFFFIMSITFIVLITGLLVVFIANVIEQHILESFIILAISILMSIIYVCSIYLIKCGILNVLELEVRDVDSKNKCYKFHNDLCSKTKIRYKKDKIRLDLVCPDLYKTKIEIFKSLLSLLLASLSADYLATYQIKDKLKKRKINYSILIKLYNITNLFLSLFLTILGLLVLYLVEDIILVSLIYILVMIRVFSRGMEIMFAFLQDTIKTKAKNTELSSGERIKLAIISLVEITILFTIVYLLFTEGSIRFESILNSFIFSLGISTLTDVNLTFEVVNNNLVSFTLAKSFVVGFQLIISLSLIVLSISQYIGNIQSESQEQE